MSTFQQQQQQWGINDRLLLLRRKKPHKITNKICQHVHVNIFVRL